MQFLGLKPTYSKIFAILACAVVADASSTLAAKALRPELRELNPMLDSGGADLLTKGTLIDVATLLIGFLALRFSSSVDPKRPIKGLPTEVAESLIQIVMMFAFCKLWLTCENTLLAFTGTNLAILIQTALEHWRIYDINTKSKAYGLSLCLAVIISTPVALRTLRTIRGK